LLKFAATAQLATMRVLGGTIALLLAAGKVRAVLLSRCIGGESGDGREGKGRKKTNGTWAVDLSRWMEERDG